MFSNYNFSNSNFFIKKKFDFFFEIFLLFFQNLFSKIENYVWNYFLYVYIRILNFLFQKLYPTPSTLNSKSRLVNPRNINVFYSLLKVRVKVISINMKSGTMNVIFVAIFLVVKQLILGKLQQTPYS